MTMKPCQFGLDCMYCHKVDDDHYVCSYPYLRLREDTDGEPIEVKECGIMPNYSKLYSILDTFERSDEMKAVFIRESERLKEEDREEVKKLLDELFGEKREF